MRVPTPLTAGPLLFVGLLGVVPLILLAAAGLAGGGDALLPSSSALPWIANSLLVAGGAASIATLLGAPAGLLLGRTDLPGRVLWAAILAFPILLPPVLGAEGWRPWLGAWAEADPPLVFRVASAAMVLGFLHVPVPLLLAALTLRRANRALEDAAFLYAGPRRALPFLLRACSREALGLGALLVFVLALSEADVASLFGVPTHEIRVRDRALRGWAPLPLIDLLPLLAAALALVAAESRIFGRRGVDFLGRATRVAPRTFPLGRAEVAAVLSVALLAFLVTGLPLAGWILTVRGATGDAAAAAMDWAWSAGGAAFARSLIFALAGGALGVLVGAPLAYAAERGALRHAGKVDLLLVLLLVLPASVLGLALARAVPVEAFRASAMALVAASGVRCAAIGFRLTRIGLRQRGPYAEEAALLSRIPWRDRATGLILPLNAAILAAAWAVSAALVFRDGALPAALPPAAPPLALLAGEAAAAPEPRLAALALVTVLIAGTLGCAAFAAVRWLRRERPAGTESDVLAAASFR
jgi:iron(III) transport system permease protein